MKSRSGILGFVIILILAFGAVKLLGSQTPTPTVTLAPTSALGTVPPEAVATTQAQPTAFATVSYQGVTGKTAFDLLKEKHQVDSKQFDFGVMVNAIDGQSSDTTKYWLYYVNGKQPDVGADKYQTKEGEMIEWRLEPAKQ